MSSASRRLRVPSQSVAGLAWRKAAALAIVGVAAAVLPPRNLSAQDAPTDTFTIRYKGITVQPVGYFAAEAVWRERDESADIGSSFNAIPFSGTSQANLSEFRGSARQSRIGLLINGKVPAATLTGYWESDFLSSGTTSNSNESNSYTMRVRQFWGQAALKGGFSFAGGQMWSLMTTYKQGITLRQEASPATIDAQYASGFNWARQLGFRITQNVDNHVWFGLAAEGPQMTYSSRGTADATALIGTTGGSLLNATNNYSIDPAPDLVGKIVFQPGKGLSAGHYEIKLLGRLFRDRIVDTIGTYGGTHNSTTTAGGVGFAALWSLGKAADVGFSGLWGRGIGRYGTSGLPDATLNDVGEIVPIRATQALVTIETHPTPGWDIDLYGGGEYEARTSSLTLAGKGIGYGSTLNNVSGCEVEEYPTATYTPVSGTCNADTRVVWQGNIQSWIRFYKGPAGTFQWGLQYSYTARNAWSGAPATGGTTGLAPTAIDGMIFTSVRYIIP